MSPLASLNYEISVPGRVVFGWNRRVELGGLACSLGRRALVICGSRTLARGAQWEPLMKSLTDAGLEIEILTAPPREPIVDDVDQIVADLRNRRAGADDVIIGIGGGSAIDLAKAAAALAPQQAEAGVKDYLEGVGRGLKLIVAPLPLIAIPTTAGTGSEATKNAVISSFDPQFKKSLRSEGMVPRIVLIDPELSVSLPPATTAATGMDALTQLLESYVSRRATDFTRHVCTSGLRLMLPHLLTAFRDGASRPAREALSQGALLSGVALANSGLGMAHGVAAALGVHCRMPHGLACAVMLPAAVRANRRDPAIEQQLARAATELLAHETDAEEFASLRAGAKVDLLETRIDRLLDELRISRRLSAHGVVASQIPALVRDSRGNSMNGNPRTIADDELTRILEELL